MAYSTLYEIKKHLNIESSFTDDDSYINQLLSVAELAINNYCNNGLSGYTSSTIPVTIKQASLLLTAHFYLNRQIISFANGIEIPYTFQFLLNPYKNYIVE